MKYRLARNMVASVIAQLIRYGAPLAFFPYLTRVLGPEGFAKFALAATASFVVGQLIEFGYGLSAVRDLSTAKGGRQEFAQISGTVIAGRALLAFPAAVILIGAHLFLDFKDPSILIITIALSISYGFTPSWFFIGIERAWILAIIELVVALSQLILILLFANTPLAAVSMLAAPVIALAVLGNSFIVLKNGISWPDINRLRRSIAISFQFFCFTGLAPTLARSHIFLLAVMSTSTQVAYFAIADRILSAASNMAIPVIRVFLPRISNLAKTAPNSAKRTFIYVTGTLVALSLGGAVFGSLISPWAVSTLFGSNVRDASQIVATLLYAIPPLLAARLIGTLGLVPLHHERIYQRIALGTVLMGIAAAPVGIWLGEGVGLAAMRIVVETLGAGICVLVMSRLGNWSVARKQSLKDS